MIRAASGHSGCAWRLRRKRPTAPSATSPRTNAAADAGSHHRRRRSPDGERRAPRVVETSRGRWATRTEPCGAARSLREPAAARGRARPAGVERPARSAATTPRDRVRRVARAGTGFGRFDAGVTDKPARGPLASLRCDRSCGRAFARVTATPRASAGRWAGAGTAAGRAATTAADGAAAVGSAVGRSAGEALVGAAGGTGGEAGARGGRSESGSR
jgi:hypothetical protein